MSSSNDKDVFSTVHDVVAVVADSTTDDSDYSGDVKGPVVPVTKGNDLADAKFDENKKVVQTMPVEWGVAVRKLLVVAK
jgi:hypothetical protein